MWGACQVDTKRDIFPRAFNIFPHTEKDIFLLHGYSANLTFKKNIFKTRVCADHVCQTYRRYIERLVEKRQFQIERRLARNDNLV